jgi:hypothetical protein
MQRMLIKDAIGALVETPLGTSNISSKDAHTLRDDRWEQGEKDASTKILQRNLYYRRRASSWTVPFSRHARARLLVVNSAIAIAIAIASAIRDFQAAGVPPKLLSHANGTSHCCSDHCIYSNLATETVLLNSLSRSPDSNDMCGEERYEPQVFGSVHTPRLVARLRGNEVCLQTSKTSECRGCKYFPYFPLY